MITIAKQKKSYYIKVMLQVKKGQYVYTIKDFPKTAAGARYVIIPEDCLWIMKKLKAMNPFTEFIFMKKDKRLTTVSFRSRFTHRSPNSIHSPTIRHC